MNRLLCKLGLIALTAALVACGSSPPTRYFSLHAMDPAENIDEEGGTVIAFGPLRTPEYLVRKQMVTRGPGAEVKVHEYWRWAEPIDKAIHRTVALNLDSHLSGVTVVAYPYMRRYLFDYRVLGQIDRFDSDSSGRVVLQLQWTVLDNDEKALIAPRRVSYESRASDPGDPEAIASAMNRALDEFSNDLTAQLRSALAAKTPQP